MIAHHLLLGDAILLTPLIASLREQYPSAEIVLTMPVAMVPLYQARPYGVVVWPFSQRKFETVSAMLKQGGFDLAVVPGDNRHGWLAAALRSRWIVAHAGDRPAVRNWMIDEFIPYPTSPRAIGEIFAGLITEQPPRAFVKDAWPAPAYRGFELPTGPYAVIHVGARTPLKYWSTEKWRELADWLGRRALQVVWSGGPNEDAIVSGIDPEGRYRSYAGQLDLAQLWHLIANASIFISPDTGVAHVARTTGTPCVTLFGPGSALLFGRGRFWQELPCAEVTIPDFPCRDQATTFRRDVPWIRSCERSVSQCAQPRCMQSIETAMVIREAARLLDEKESAANVAI